MSDISRAIGLLAITIAIWNVGSSIDRMAAAVRAHTTMMLCVEAMKIGADCNQPKPRTDGEDG